MKKILLVEDDPDIARALSLTLKAAHYEVLVAYDCITGTALGIKSDPDLVVLDVNMPGGDGFTLASRLQENATSSPPPIIFVTASKSPEIRYKAFESGAVGFFEKPFNAHEIIDCIESTLDAA